MATAPTSPVRAARIAPNTLNTRRIPIVFVPGIMGSRLSFPNCGQFWDPDSSYNMSHWYSCWASTAMAEMDCRQTAAVMTDAADDMTPIQAQRGWAGVMWSSYKSILQFLASQNLSPAFCPVYAVGYDWRQSNRDSGQYLINKVNGIMSDAKAKKVIFVTHSMGGLVTRAALKADSGLAGKTLGVIHTVHPAHGAVCLYRRFFTGVEGFEDDPSGFARILGNTGDKFSAIASGMPGVFELLPNNLYRADGGVNWLAYIDASCTKQFWTGNVYDLYRSATHPPGFPDSTEATGVLARLQDKIAKAEAFASWIGDYKLTGKTYSIYGSGIATDTSIVFDPPVRPAPVRYNMRGGATTRPAPWPNYGAKEQRPLNGDGTVPQTSADALFPSETTATTFNPKGTDHQFVVSPMGHQPACQNSTTQSIVLGILRKLLGI